MSDLQDAVFIDTTEKLQKLLSKLVNLDARVPELFIDLEGDNISCGGPLSILQLLFFRVRCVYLIDLHVLGNDAFSTTASSGTTLKSILESPDVAKALFDVRADSNALFIQYDIKLAGVHDIQLMEIATQQGWTKCVNGLARCIQGDAKLTPSQLRRWTSSKEEGKKLFDTKFGGSYSVFNERPLSEAVRAYCVQDVLLLPTLWLKYSQKLDSAWLQRVEGETGKRLENSQKKAPIGNGRHMALGPAAWISITRTSVDWPAKTHPEFAAGCQELAEQLQDLQVTSEPAGQSHRQGGRAFDLQGLAVALSGAATRPSLLPTSESPDFDLEHDLDWSDGDGSEKDFTACSADDCGYCGHCDY